MRDVDIIVRVKLHIKFEGFEGAQLLRSAPQQTWRPEAANRGEELEILSSPLIHSAITS